MAMTLAETLRLGRLARSQAAVREPAGKAPAEPVARVQPAASAAKPEPGLRDWFGIMAMGIGLFMAIMDVQIVTSSLTQIQGGLSASTDEIAWVQTAYLIADVVMVPMCGIMSRLFSTRVVFVVAALGFTGTSALCATATSLGQMIVYRAMQGFLWRRNHADRVAGRLHQVPRPAAGDRHCDYLSYSEPVIDLGSDPRRVFD
jgi:Major Facilitator Superfamily